MSTHDTSDDFSGDRIAKVLSRAGVASRRDAERMITEGRVKVNGKPITSPALNVGPKDRITVDGTEIGAPEPVRMWLYHKPAGLVTTTKDEEGRPTVFDQLPEGMPYVMSVGRLDLNSEGLLLLTNDGEIKRRLELPSTGWLRRYRVRVNGEVGETLLAAMRAGVTIDKVMYAPMEVTLDRQQGANAWLTVGLREGKNREIRRVMEHLGVQVNRLIRISYGPFQLGDLAPGEVEELKAKVVREQLGIAREKSEPQPLKPAGRPVLAAPKAAAGLSARARAELKAPKVVRRPRALVDEETGEGLPRYKNAEAASKRADGLERRPSKDAPRKSFGDRDGAPRKSFGDRDGAPRKSFGDRDGAPRKSFGDRDGAPRKSFGDRDGAPRKSFGDRDGAPRKSFGDRDGAPRKSFGDRDGAPRKSFGDRDGAPRKSFGDRDGAPRKSFGDRDSAPRKSFGDRDGAPRKSFGDRDSAPRKSFGDRDGAPRKSFGDRDGAPRKSFGGKLAGGFGGKPSGRPAGAGPRKGPPRKG